jgi:hypothetical protein
MHIIKTTQTSGGVNARGRKAVGGSIHFGRKMNNPTKGFGMDKEFYSKSIDEGNQANTYTPSNVKKFDKIKVKGSKTKNYITF